MHACMHICIYAYMHIYRHTIDVTCTHRERERERERERDGLTRSVLTGGWSEVRWHSCVCSSAAESAQQCSARECHQKAQRIHGQRGPRKHHQSRGSPGSPHLVPVPSCASVAALHDARLFPTDDPELQEQREQEGVGLWGGGRGASSNFGTHRAAVTTVSITPSHH